MKVGDRVEIRAAHFNGSAIVMRWEERRVARIEGNHFVTDDYRIYDMRDREAMGDKAPWRPADMEVR